MTQLNHYAWRYMKNERSWHILLYLPTWFMFMRFAMVPYEPVDLPYFFSPQIGDRWRQNYEICRSCSMWKRPTAMQLGRCLVHRIHRPARMRPFSLAHQFTKLPCFPFYTVTQSSQTYTVTHWGSVSHICINIYAIICLDNGFSSIRRQIIIWTNAVL